MNLSDYITLTLTEIAEGVQKVNEAYEVMGGGYVLTEAKMEIEGMPVAKRGYARKPIINVGFRIGVELEESKEKGGQFGGTIKVISASTDVSKKDGAKSVHEITFQIPLILPED
jgi:hypothetical protein